MRKVYKWLLNHNDLMTLVDRIRSEGQEMVVDLLNLRFPTSTTTTTIGDEEVEVPFLPYDLGYLDDEETFDLAVRYFAKQFQGDHDQTKEYLGKIGGVCSRPQLIRNPDTPDDPIMGIFVTYWKQENEALETFVRGHEYGHAIEMVDRLGTLRKAIKDNTGLDFPLEGYREEVVSSIAGIYALSLKGLEWSSGIYESYPGVQTAKSIWAEKALLHKFQNLDELVDASVQKALESAGIFRNDPETVGKAVTHLQAKAREPRAEASVGTVEKYRIEHDFSPELNKNTPFSDFFPGFEQELIGDTEIDMTTTDHERTYLRNYIQQMRDGEDVNEAIGVVYSLITPWKMPHEDFLTYISEINEGKQIIGEGENDTDKDMGKVLEFITSLLVDDYDVEIRFQDWKAKVNKKVRKTLKLEFDVEKTDEIVDNLEISVKGSNPQLTEYFINNHPAHSPQYIVPIYTSRAGNRIIAEAEKRSYSPHHISGELLANDFRINGESVPGANFSYSYELPSLTLEELLKSSMKKGKDGKLVKVEFRDLNTEEIDGLYRELGEILAYAPKEVISTILLAASENTEGINAFIHHEGTGVPVGERLFAAEHNKDTFSAMEKHYGPAGMKEIAKYWSEVFYETFGEDACIKSTYLTGAALVSRTGDEEVDKDSRDLFGKCLMQSGKGPKVSKDKAWFLSEGPDIGLNAVDLAQGPVYLLARYGGVKMDFQMEEVA